MKKIIGLLTLFLASASVQAQMPYGLSERIPNSAFKLRSVGNKLAEKTLENAFPNLRFDESLFLTHAGDGSDRIFVVEKGGVVYVFENNPSVTSAEKFLDISARLSGVGETGLLSLAFHPDFAENKKFYISYCDAGLISTISEMQVSGNPNQANLSTERILLQMQQPQRNHNGGHIAFGPDGYLYIAFGDGFSQSGQDGTTNDGDPLENGQDRENWFSCILRIDVDNKDAGLEYAIPHDNPFAGNDQNWKEEIFAYGFRNPWRFSFDQATGVLWLADVGHKLVEEIDIVESGKNYGWSLKEGRHCYIDQDAICDSSLWVGLEDPIFEFTRDLGESVTGGYVYRGTAHQSLTGLYIYGDFNLRKVWALQYENGVAQNVLSLTCPQNISSFGEDESGEVYVVGYQGSIYRFKDNDDTLEDIIPARLSESGLFADIANKVHSPGLIPYQVNSPLWSDGADKTRLLALPDTTRIEFMKEGFWQFPENAVLLKNFFLEMEKGNPDSKRIIETRFLVKRYKGDEWDGYAYEWLDDESDALLLESSKTKSVVIQDGSAPGGEITHNYYFPSRDDCNTCHTAAAGYVLGVTTAQLNSEYDYGGIVDQQLRTLNHIRMFTTDIGEDYAGFPDLANPADEGRTAAERARSYLDANCSQCHRPGGTGRSGFDLRASTHLDETQLLDLAATFGGLGTANGRILEQGSPENSVLYLRMTRTDEFRMPPLATSIVDELGTQIVDEWIRTLQDPISVHSLHASITTEFRLHPAYPNPFNPTCNITFDLPRGEQVRVTVMNIMGQVIDELADRRFEPGRHTVSWDGRDTLGRAVASGVYIYSIVAGSFRESRKMVLCR
jgi:uncharacterized repeat protein (TIGR03806 family)